MCNCIALLNAKLIEDGHNTEIAVSHWFSGGQPTRDTVIVQVEKRDPKNRTKPIRLIPEFCPFCGEPYEALAIERDEGQAGEGE